MTMTPKSRADARNRIGAKQSRQISPEMLKRAPKRKSATVIKATKKITDKETEKQNVSEPWKSDITSSADEMPLDSRLSTLKKRAIAKKSSAAAASKIGVEKRAIETSSPSYSKPSFPSLVNQTTTGRARRAENEEDICNEFLDKCDKQILLNIMVKKFDVKEILKVYKENRNTWEKQRFQEEASSRVLDINLENQSSDSATKMASLQKVLQELMNLVESKAEFLEMVLKTYGHEMDAVKFFELLDSEQMKRVVHQKLSANELIELIHQSDNRALISQILEMASVDAIAHEIQARNDSGTSQKLLKVLLEMVSELAPDATIEVIKSKKFFKTSESLLNYMLENVKEILSKDTKKNISNVLINQFESDELADLFREYMKSSRNTKRIDTVEISN